MAFFGNPNTGGSSVQSPPAGNKAVSQFVVDFSGAVSSVTFVYTTATTSRAVIYADNSNAPGALAGVSTELVASGAGAKTYTFSPAVNVVAGRQYWLGVWSSTQGVSNGTQTSPVSTVYYNANTYSSTANPSDPFGSPSTNTIRYPVQATYAPTLPAGTYAGYLNSGDITNLATNWTVNNLIVFPASGTGSVLSITAFLANNVGGANAQAVIYDATGTGGAPGNLLGSSRVVTNPTINANSFIFSTPVSVSGNFFIGLIVDTSLPTYSISGGNTAYILSRLYSLGPPSTFGTGYTTSTNNTTIWANFASTSTQIQVAQSFAEVLHVGASPQIQAIQVVAEVLRAGAATTQIRIIQTAAEVLRSSLAAPTMMWPGFETREALLATLPAQGRLGLEAREALTTTLTNVRGSFSYVAREMLASATALPTRLQQGGAIREILYRPPTFAWPGMALREALLTTASATQDWVGGLLREALWTQPSISRVAGEAREALTTTLTPIVASFGYVFRETLASLAFVTLLRQSTLVRETLYMPVMLWQSAAIREALFTTAPALPSAGRFDTVVRETLLFPRSLARFADNVREALIYPGPARLTVSMVVREALEILPPPPGMFSALVRETLKTPTMLRVGSLLRERLYFGLTLLAMGDLIREILIRDPIPRAPQKHRKAYVWINFKEAPHA